MARKRKMGLIGRGGIQWASTLLTAFLLAVFFFFAGRTAYLVRETQDSATYVGIASGTLIFGRWQYEDPSIPRLQHGFHYGRTMVTQINWLPSWNTVDYPEQSLRHGKVPLWPLVALLLLVTIKLWRRHRCVLPGHCRYCRYDLAGIETTVCPECGKPTGREA